MFVDIMIRRRARLDEPIPALNRRLVEQLVAVPGFWGQGRTAADSPFEQDETGSLDLRRALRDGLSGQILYMARFAGYLTKDVTKADDTLRVRLDTDKIDYAAFCHETLPQLVTIFGAYRGHVATDAKVRAADWDVVRQQTRITGRDVDGRDGIFRFWPVCWFDAELSQRAFGIGVDEALSRVAAECERAELVAGCAFLRTEFCTAPNLPIMNGLPSSPCCRTSRVAFPELTIVVSSMASSGSCALQHLGVICPRCSVRTPHLTTVSSVGGGLVSWAAS